MSQENIKQIKRESTYNVLNSKQHPLVDDILNEGSLNRLLKWIEKHDIAILTAYRDVFENETSNTLYDRPQGYDNTKLYKYTTKAKVNRNRDLKAILLHKGYGVTNIRGNYIENFGTINAQEVGEHSFFVVNLNHDPNFQQTIFELSEYYNQDSFLFKPQNSSTAYLIGTNYAEFPNYQNKISIGNLHINVDTECLSRVGNNSFSFTDELNPKANDNPTTFTKRKLERKQVLKEMLNINTIENYSISGKQVICAISNKIKKSLYEMKDIYT